jgi:uroporphyrinogen III methyltransferase/synthase
VHEVPVYRTLPAWPEAAELEALRQGVDVITFTSASTVRNFVSLLSQVGLPLAQVLQRARVACIGPVTAQAARDLGLPVDVQADVYTLEGLVAAVDHHLVQPDHAGRSR